MEQPYDVIPYGLESIPSSHPNRLAVVARLRGMNPAPVDGCRVLELGCARGGNLLPMAELLPHSRFLGIDFSPGQIAEAQQYTLTLELKNIEFQTLNVMDIGADFGTFDYIIAHGIFSWVPHAVQEKLLEVCARHLAPQGVAYVSYNTYPGWHEREMIRDMMLFHTREEQDPHARLRRAREWLGFFSTCVANDSGPHGTIRRELTHTLAGLPDYYFFHEYLEGDNHPLYFHEFASRTSAKGLQYLGDADFHNSSMHYFPPEVAAGVRAFAKDMVQMEQYLDVLRNQTFRRTLLCRADVPLRTSLAPELLFEMHFVSSYRPTRPGEDVRDESSVRFKDVRDREFVIDDPTVKTIFGIMGESWPAYMSFDALCTGVGARVPGVAPSRRSLAIRLLQEYLTDRLDIVLHPAPVTRTVTICPRVADWARLQACANTRITNLHHELIEVSTLGRAVLNALNGVHNYDAICSIIDGLVRQGVLKPNVPGGLPDDPGERKSRLGECVRQTLFGLAESGFLLRPLSDSLAIVSSDVLQRAASA